MFPEGWKETFFSSWIFTWTEGFFKKSWFVCQTHNVRLLWIYTSFLFNIPAASLRLKWPGTDQTTKKLFLAINIMLLSINAAKHYQIICFLLPCSKFHTNNWPEFCKLSVFEGISPDLSSTFNSNFDSVSCWGFFCGQQKVKRVGLVLT